MANASAITIRPLTENTVLAQPTADVLDTGTDAVTIPITPAGDTHNILLEFTNTAQAADTMTVKILAGDNPPAQAAGLGDLTFTVAQNAVKYLVLESARFMQSDGKINITITPANGKTQTMTVRAYKLPK
jgi:hypothetical protein